jgi:hypothetical protein
MKEVAVSDIEYIGPEKREFGGKAGGVKFRVPEFVDEKTPRIVEFAAPSPGGEAELLGAVSPRDGNPNFRKVRPARADKPADKAKE